MKKNRKGIIILIIAFLGASGLGAAQDCPIIPFPSKIDRAAGELDLRGLKQIFVNDEKLVDVAHYLQKEVLDHSGLAFSLAPGAKAGKGINIALDANSKIPGEGYHLNISPNNVKIIASTPHGAFNGVASLLQVIRIASIENSKLSIPCWQIQDAPAMEWRGIMLDESRHFFGKETVKKILDWMAFYKLNRFHWHLTDAPGWRIEIKQYPKLALIGGIGNHTNPLAPAAYYTHDDINEIVRYAKERFIEVIPEIDMPGHATAANRAYPEYNGGGSEKHPDFTFNPGKEETYVYLTNILKEVDVLFPSKMIHLGGDEVHFGNEKWNRDEAIQHLMEENSLDDLKAVEQYFIERMADSVLRLNSRVLGWDEIATTNISPEKMIIFWWRHNKPRALKSALDNGYRVVLCPRVPLYLDFIQDSTHTSGRKWAGTFSDLERIYHYSIDQHPQIIEQKNRDLVAGIQANIWTEKIASEARLEYMLFPRISGVAEAGWTLPDSRDYAKFMDRLSLHNNVYEKADLHYYDPGSPALTPEIIDYIPKNR